MYKDFHINKKIIAIKIYKRIIYMNSLTSSFLYLKNRNVFFVFINNLYYLTDALVNLYLIKYEIIHIMTPSYLM